MNWITIVSVHHKEWVSLVKQWGEYFYADDLVQEMYIKLYNSTTEEKIVKSGKLNKGYVWFCLRSVFIDFQRSKKFDKVSLDSLNLSDESIDFDKEFAHDRLFNEIEDEINSWHWYDIKMFRIYMNTDMSMRDMENEINIPLSNIFTTIKSCKKRIANRIGEDFEDFKNQEYELI